MNDELYHSFICHQLKTNLNTSSNQIMCLQSSSIHLKLPSVSELVSSEQLQVFAMPFPYFTILCEVTEAIPKTLLPLEVMTVKDTKLLKVRKGRNQKEQPPVRCFPQNEHKSRNSGFILESFLVSSESLDKLSFC